jgi:hypothetical protein
MRFSAGQWEEVSHHLVVILHVEEFELYAEHGKSFTDLPQLERKE